MFSEFVVYVPRKIETTTLLLARLPVYIILIRNKTEIGGKRCIAFVLEQLPGQSYQLYLQQGFRNTVLMKKYYHFSADADDNLYNTHTYMYRG